MRPGGLAILLAAALAAALAACSAGSPSPSGIAFEGNGVRFVAPPGWDVRTSTMLEYGPGSRIGYLANQPLRDDCSAEDPQTCPGPVDQLRDDGVLLVWLTTNCAGPRCVLPAGQWTTVGGRAAAIAEIPGTACAEIGQTEESVIVVAVSPQRLDTIVVCARLPSGGTLATLRAFLDAVDWRTP